MKKTLLMAFTAVIISACSTVNQDKKVDETVSSHDISVAMELLASRMNKYRQPENIVEITVNADQSIEILTVDGTRSDFVDGTYFKFKKESGVVTFVESYGFTR